MPSKQQTKTVTESPSPSTEAPVDSRPVFSFAEVLQSARYLQERKVLCLICGFRKADWDNPVSESRAQYCTGCQVKHKLHTNYPRQQKVTEFDAFLCEGVARFVDTVLTKQ